MDLERLKFVKINSRSVECNDSEYNRPWYNVMNVNTVFYKIICFVFSAFRVTKCTSVA